MERDAAEMEVRRRLRDTGARLSPLSDDGDCHGELLRLLQEAAKLLYRVNQCQLDRMHSALIPLMRTLIKKELLDHPDPGVKLAVASCLTVLIKIHAPDPPYDDDVMKDGSSLLLRSSVNWMMWTAPPMEQGFQCLKLLQGHGVVPCC